MHPSQTLTRDRYDYLVCTISIKIITKDVQNGGAVSIVEVRDDRKLPLSIPKLELLIGTCIFVDNRQYGIIDSLKSMTFEISSERNCRQPRRNIPITSTETIYAAGSRPTLPAHNLPGR